MEKGLKNGEPCKSIKNLNKKGVVPQKLERRWKWVRLTCNESMLKISGQYIFSSSCIYLKRYIYLVVCVQNWILNSFIHCHHNQCHLISLHLLLDISGTRKGIAPCILALFEWTNKKCLFKKLCVVRIFRLVVWERT